MWGGEIIIAFDTKTARGLKQTALKKKREKTERALNQFSAVP